MLTQQSDVTENVVYLTLENEVLPTDLAGHRRAAVLAARDLGRPFSVVTDLTECAQISPTAAEELRETVEHLVPFGLETELRVVSEDTPGDVVAAIRHSSREFDVDVVTVPTLTEAKEKLSESEKARC